MNISAKFVILRKNEETCCKCGRPIQDEYFDAVSGKMCPKCLKEMQVYYALRSMGLIRTTEEGNVNGAK